MRHLLPLLAVLLFAPVAHADGFAPGFKFTRGSRVVHFGPEAERYQVFVICYGRCAALNLVPDRAAQVPHLGPRGMGESLCAIPAGTPLPEKLTEEWLKSVPGAVCSGTFQESLRRDRPIYDPRDGYDLHYRATFTPGELQLELTGERVEWSGATLFGWSLFALAITAGGVWLIRRRAKRTTPPPP